MYPGGGVEISGSVKAYFALKLTGHDPAREYMQRARQAILAHGGADAVNSYTRFFLAMLGPDLLRPVPGGPARGRAPAQVVSGQPLRREHLVADDHRAVVDRLGAAAGAAARPGAGHPRAVFEGPAGLAAAALPGPGRRHGPVQLGPLLPHGRSAAEVVPAARLVAAAQPSDRGRERWMPIDSSGATAWGRSFRRSSAASSPCGAWATTTTAPRCRTATSNLKTWSSKTTVGLDPRCSRANRRCGTRRSPCGPWPPAASRPTSRPARGSQWLLEQQITRPGDWAKRSTPSRADGASSSHNDFYPDCDDTAMVLMALAEQFGGPVGADEPPAARVAAGEPTASPAEELARG